MKKAAAAGAVFLLYGCASAPPVESVYVPAPYDPPYTLTASDSEICTHAAALPETATHRKAWVTAFLARGLDLQKCGPHHAENVELKKREIAALDRQIEAARDRQATIQRTQAAQRQSNNNAAAALFTGLAAFAIAQDARRGAYMPLQAPARQVSDYEWQWDEFYGPNGQLMWMCRGVQTGMFAEDLRCMGKAKIDFFWPDKRAPF